MSAPEAAKETERLAVTVELTVTHSVWVKLDAESDQTLDALKAEAIREFHAKDGYSRSRRSDSGWREQFHNRSNIEVGTEQVVIAAVSSRPVSEGRRWS